MASRFVFRALCLGLVSSLALVACSTGPGLSAIPSTSGSDGPASVLTSPAAPTISTAAPEPASADVTSASASGAAATPSAASPRTTAKPAATATSPTTTVQTGGLAVHKNADGTCTMPAKFAGKDMASLGTASSRKVIALTFDGGASNAGDQKILQVLAAKKATATFFFTGKFAVAYPATVKQIAALYPIGNHSYTHPNFTQISDATVAEEIRTAEAAIIKASGGVGGLPFFRFPYGDVNTHAIQQVNKQCYVPFRWTIDTIGYNGTSSGNSASKIVAKVLANATPGGIVLMHQGDNPADHSTLDADALADMIDGLRAKGYELVTLQEALRA